MGLTGQSATVDELLTGRENLWLIGSLYGLDRRTIARIGDELLERFSLSGAADRVVKTYSGGMRRRLDLAVSLVATPPVLFLDEPTTGLDPRSRVELWDVLRDLVADGTTLLLTTQYLEEADQLADDIVVIDRGKVIAQGTPLQLKDASGKASLVVTVSRSEDLPGAVERVRSAGLEVHVEESARRITAPAEGLSDITRIAALFDGSGIEIDDLGLQRPSLDDVFLNLTGHRAEEADPSDDLSDDPSREPDETEGQEVRA
jgi:ABC-2 type transport system ATP-binding protein